MINKVSFVEIIKNIKKQEEIDNKISSALELVSDSYVLFEGSKYIKSSLLKLLQEVFKDADDYIGWWLYEDTKKKVWEKQENKIIEHDLTKVEDLYDFLIINMENK